MQMVRHIRCFSCLLFCFPQLLGSRERWWKGFRKGDLVTLCWWRNFYHACQCVYLQAGHQTQKRKEVFLEIFYAFERRLHSFQKEMVRNTFINFDVCFLKRNICLSTKIMLFECYYLLHFFVYIVQVFKK